MLTVLLQPSPTWKLSGAFNEPQMEAIWRIHGQVQVAEDGTLTASLEISVVENLHARVTYTCSNHVLIAPVSTLQLQTNRDGKTVFSMQDSSSSSVTVTNRGQLKVSSGVTSKTTSVMASVEEDIGVYVHTSWVVEVRPVHYVVFESVENHSWKSKAGSSVLPKGGTLRGVVSCYDTLGRKFQSCPLDLKIRPSRFDLTKIVAESNDTTSITPLADGFTVLKITDTISSLTTWAVMQVGESI